MSQATSSVRTVLLDRIPKRVQNSRPILSHGFPRSNSVYGGSRMSSYDFYSRRDFLKGASAFGAMSVAMWMGGCESCQQQIANRPTRRNIANLAANDPIIDAYKNAVTAMMALPSTDPRNWTKQARIHYDHCPHGKRWFL